jgi:hypothetical protein
MALTEQLTGRTASFKKGTGGSPPVRRGHTT